MATTTDDTLLINRQAELHDKVAVALYHQPFQTLLDQGHDGWARAVRDVCTALGVGKPDPVRESDLRGTLALAQGDAPDWDLRQWEDVADRIERAIGEKP